MLSINYEHSFRIRLKRQRYFTSSPRSRRLIRSARSSKASAAELPSCSVAANLTSGPKQSSSPPVRDLDGMAGPYVDEDVKLPCFLTVFPSSLSDEDDDESFEDESDEDEVEEDDDDDRRLDFFDFLVFFLSLTFVLLVTLIVDASPVSLGGSEGPNSSSTLLAIELIYVLYFSN
jgi:hypothetical protein